MEVGSPENGFDEISDLFKHGESTLPGDLDLSFLMNKDIAAEYVFDGLEGEDKFNFCFSEQGHSHLPSLLSNYRHYDPPEPSVGNLHSPARIGCSSEFLLGADDGIVLNEKMQMRSPENHQHEDMEKLCSGYLRDFASQADFETIGSETPEVFCRQTQVLGSMGHPELEAETLDRPDSHPDNNVGEETFSVLLPQELDQSEFTLNKGGGGEEEEEDVPVFYGAEKFYVSVESKIEEINDSRNSRDGSKELKELDSPCSAQYDKERTSQDVYSGAIGEICIPPETSHCVIKVPHDRKLSALHGPHDVLQSSVLLDLQCCQAECFDPTENLLSVNQSSHACMETCASSKGSPANHVHTAHINQLGVKRSRSQSPVRQTYSSSRCKKDSSTNSEARTPQSRNRGKRSSDTGACSYQSLGSHNRCVIRGGHKEQSCYSSSRHHRNELARTSDQGREVNSKHHLQRGSRRVIKDCSSSKRTPASPRNHSLENKSHWKAERSGSPSPVSRRNLDRKRGESHSRSPHAKDDSRTRYSSRHKSSSGICSAHCKASQARYLPPASYRRTGIGKRGTCLFVAGFEFATTERELERKFSRFGYVRDVRIIRDKRSGLSRGYGFVSLGREGEADAAIRALHRTEWNGRLVLVEKSIK